MRVLEQSEIKGIKEVRLVGEGKNDIIPAGKAWEIAEEEGMDLVLVSSETAVPPVVRIQDYKKLQYEKKKQKSKQTKHRSELKEIQLKANISDHDLQTKLNNIDKFLDRGDKVKIIVRLKGRERDYPQRAHDLIDRVVDSITVACRPNKLPGPIAMAILEPISAK